MKSEITDPVATTSFDLVRSDGTRTRLDVVIGRPHVIDEFESRCPVKIDGLGPQYSDISGSDTLQAICLALQFARRQLEAQLDRGYELTAPEDESRHDRSSLTAMFGGDPFGPS